MLYVFYINFNIIYIKYNNKLEEISDFFVQFYKDGLI